MEKPMNEAPLMEVGEKNIVLFHPHISEKSREYVNDTLHTRWIGQGPKVDKFEKNFSEKFGNGNVSLSCGSGTDALHLAYLLANLKEGDEVITPLFTCTATNIPFLYMGVKIVFADVQPGTLNIDPNHVKKLVNSKTKAIVCVHYGGLPCDMDELQAIANEWNIPIIEDAAHAVGAKYKGKPIGSISDFTMFSFQAIKHITTGDGGMVTFKNDEKLLERGKRLRWFGIDRSAKQKGIWENDITDIGYKYQMNDISAAMGLAALEEFDEVLKLRKELFSKYESLLINIPGLNFIGGGYNDREHAAWMSTITVENRDGISKKLRENNIESAQVHYRNDRYSIFGGRKNEFPNMDAIEDKYLVLPLHTKMDITDVERVCDVIKSGW
jgi:dTDP-4-amino-4,6-dideoxygalactose transaminase